MVYFQTIPAIFWTVSSYRFNHQPSVGLVIIFFISFIYWLSMFCLISNFLIEKVFKFQSNSKNQKLLISIFLLLFLSWSLYLFVFDPGIMTNDSYNQWRQANGYLPLSEWHPLIHTYLIKLASYFYYSPSSFLLAQIFFASLLVSFLMKKFLDRGVSPKIIVFITLIYAFYPINGFYFSTLWKDIPYSILLLAFFYYFKELIDSKGLFLNQNRSFLLFLSISFLTIEFRKNGAIVVILCLFLALLFLQNRKRIIVTLFLLFIMMSSFSFYNKKVVKAEESPVVEALSIPIQQIAYVYSHDGNTNKADDAYFYSILPEEQWKKNYKSMTVDPIKFSSQFKGEIINENFSGFLKNWFSLLKKNFVSFVKAYLLQTASIWRYYTPHGYSVYLDSPYEIEEKNGIYLSLIATKERSSIVREDYNLYKAAAKSAGQDYISYSEYYENRKHGDFILLKNRDQHRQLRHFFRNIFLIMNKEQKYVLRGALAVLVLLISIGICGYKIGILKSLMIFSPFMINLGTLLISVPATDFRYIFSLYFSIPFIMLTAFSYNDLKNSNIKPK
ncbi:DUF6020 family protein [Enterococcus sp. AZ128]|uniref:DUF6020 family protein n=1 Tax=unclassified Enterococcus TaxID=2608891 RepID=UPI003F68669C